MDRRSVSTGELLKRAMDQALSELPVPDFAAVQGLAARATGRPKAVRNRRVAFIAAAALLAAGGAATLVAGTRHATRVAVEQGTRAMVERLFSSRLLEGAETFPASSLGGGGDGLFLRSFWSDSWLSL